MSGFSLHSEVGGLILALPETLRPVGPLGEPDAHTWVRILGGGWKPMGTGLTDTPPTLRLAGMTGHSSVASAMGLAAAIEQALPTAHALYFGGTYLVSLNGAAPGAYEPEFLTTGYNVNHVLTLNTSRVVRPSAFVTNLPPETPVTPTPSAPYLTTTTVLIEGVPIEIQVWRQD